jgi:hypothetical protein
MTNTAGTTLETPATCLTEKWWFIAVLLVFCFPIGLLLVWKHPHWTNAVKWAWTAGFVCLVIVGAFMDSKENGERKEGAEQSGAHEGEPVAGVDYYAEEDVGLGSRAMLVKRNGEQVLVRRKVPKEHIGLGVSVEGYDAIQTDMTEEEVQSIVGQSGEVLGYDDARKHISYTKGWLGGKSISVVYRRGYKAWVVNDKSRVGF